MRAVVVAALLALGGCSEPADRWAGYAYPDGNNLGDARYVGSFTTLDECRRAALAMLESLHSDRYRGDYECGNGRETAD
jgi:hypothetical protein